MANQDAELPEYRLLERSFIAPYLLEAGSRIRTTAKPHNGWAPLNAAAQAALDAWYEESFPAVDEKFKPIIGPDGKRVMVQPHLKFKPNEFGEIERPGEHSVQVLAVPDPKAVKNVQGLADSLFGRRADTDPRPGPAVPPDYSKEVEVSTDGQTQFVESTPRPKRTA